MKIYQPQSKNILTLFWVVAVSFVGSVALTALTKTTQPISEYGNPFSINPYVTALYPMLYAGLPVLLLAGFIFGIFSVAREATNLGKTQAVTSMVILLIIAYVVSFTLFSKGYF